VADLNNGENGQSADQNATHVQKELPVDGHLEYRKCAACGHTKMTAQSAFSGTTMGDSHEHGLTYKCPDCGSVVDISDSGTFFMGAVFSLFWIAVGTWAFYAGPLWYLRHLSYFDDYDPAFILLDAGTIILSVGAIAFSIWTVWISLLKPAIINLRHPVTGENRPKTSSEEGKERITRRTAILSLLVYPIVLWAMFLGIYWLLDALGFDIRGNDFYKYAGALVVLSIGAMLSRRLGANLGFMFVGMAIWLGVFVTALFAF